MKQHILSKKIMTHVEFVGKTQRVVDDAINLWIKERKVGEILEGIGKRIEIGFHGSIEHQICRSYEGPMEHRSIVLFRETFEELQED